MGSRDYRHREVKKAKKAAKKVSESPVMTSPVTVEVVKKRKKTEEEERAEE